MARKHKQESGQQHLLVMLVGLPWWCSLVVGCVAFVAFYWLVPAVLAGSPLLSGVVPAARAVAWLALLGFAATGFVALLRATVLKRYRRRAGKVRDKHETHNRGEPALHSARLLKLGAAAAPAPSLPAQPHFHGWSLEALRALEWKRFELLTARYYAALGFRTETIAAGPDGGIDVKLFRSDPHKPLALVQCKAWNVNAVGVKELRELLGVMAHEKVQRGVFVTSGVFTREASNFGEANPIQMLDGPAFLKKLLDLPAHERETLFHEAFEGDFTTPTCASCGIRMVRREGGRGPFWGCRNYPGCTSRFPMRAAA